MKPICPLAWLLLAGLAVGCGTYTQPVIVEPELAVVEPGFLATWQASRDVLGSYRFRVVELDLRAGRLTTDAITAQHGAEFWRRDASTLYDWLEGTLHTVRRSAVVQIVPDPQHATGYRARVTVRTVRSNRPEPYVTSTSSALNLLRLTGGFRPDLTLAERTADALAGPRPVVTPLGPDETLAARIARDIDTQAARRLPRLQALATP